MYLFSSSFLNFKKVYNITDLNLKNSNQNNRSYRRDREFSVKNKKSIKFDKNNQNFLNQTNSVQELASTSSSSSSSFIEIKKDYFEIITNEAKTYRRKNLVINNNLLVISIIIVLTNFSILIKQQLFPTKTIFIQCAPLNNNNNNRNNYYNYNYYQHHNAYWLQQNELASSDTDADTDVIKLNDNSNVDENNNDDADYDAVELKQKNSTTTNKKQNHLKQKSLPTTTTTTTNPNNNHVVAEQTKNNNLNENNTEPSDDNDAWLQSEFARQQVASFVFNEFREKNFNENLTNINSSGDLGALELIGLGAGSGGTGDGSSGGLVNSFAFEAANAGDNDLSSIRGVSMSAAAGSGSTSSHGNASSGSSATTFIGGAIGGSNLNNNNNNSISAAHVGRPYWGDALQTFQTVYWPIHCVICLVICTLGIFANVLNIIVLTRPNMITAVNTILSAMAFSDLVVNISTIPYLIHQLSDSSNSTLSWARYILVHAHTSVTAHTISIWLTCVLATWRYFVVCRSQSSSQRNWSVGLAKKTILAVFTLVPCFCIPNYLSFAIVEDTGDKNITIYRVGFSHLADESDFIKTFHFWIFSCLTKLLPCVLLSFFTTVLIRKLLSARERRVRLATYGGINSRSKDEEHYNGQTMLPNNGSSPNRFNVANEKVDGGKKMSVKITNKSCDDNNKTNEQANSLINEENKQNMVFNEHDRYYNRTIDESSGHHNHHLRDRQINKNEELDSDSDSIGNVNNNNNNNNKNNNNNNNSRESCDDLNSSSIVKQSKESTSDLTTRDMKTGNSSQNDYESCSNNNNNINNSNSNSNSNKKQQASCCQQSNSSCAFTEAEIIAGNSCSGSLSGVDSCNNNNNNNSNDNNSIIIANQNNPRILSQLIVESGANNCSSSTILTSTAPTKMLASCDNIGQQQQQKQTIIYNNLFEPISATATSHNNQKITQPAHLDTTRSASTCGGFEFYPSVNRLGGGSGSQQEQQFYDNKIHNNDNNNNNTITNTNTNDKQLASSKMVTSQELLSPISNRKLQQQSGGAFNSNRIIHQQVGSDSCYLNSNSTANILENDCTGFNGSSLRFLEKRSSDNVYNSLTNNNSQTNTNATNNNRGRSMGSTTLAPLQLVKLHASQRQLSQNETTTRLLIAVMIVFLICEFPAGILAALCAILGQDFWENVYHPIGIVTDLLALINSSVNFILYCFMSTQFRITFYRVVLHCPAPNVPQQSVQHNNINNNHNQQQTNNNIVNKILQQNKSTMTNVNQLQFGEETKPLSNAGQSSATPDNKQTNSSTYRLNI